MATRKYPGYGKSKGAADGFRTYDQGEYVMDVLSAKLTLDDERNPRFLDKWEFKLVIREGPEQADDGKVPVGGQYTEFLYIMLPEHASAEEHGHIGVDQLKSIALACGVESKGDSPPDPDDFAGQTVRVYLKKKNEILKKDTKNAKAGDSIEKNEARRWRAFKE